MELTTEQKSTMEKLRSGKNVFITGGAGTGKTYLLRCYADEMEAAGKNVIVCAPTGIAAIQIGGATIHRVFGVPIEPLGPVVGKYSEIISTADVIVIDEISMVRYDVFAYISNMILRAKKEKKDGIQVVVCGDFLQLPPVITPTDRKALETLWQGIVNVGKGYAFMAPCWQDYDFENIILHDIVRQNDAEFAKALNQVRVGQKAGLDWIMHQASKTVEKAIYLCATRQEVAEKNEEETAKIKGKQRSYYADIEGRVQETDKITADKLVLKEGMQVMTLVNDPQERYQNGSIGTISRLCDGCVFVDFGGKIVPIYPYTWHVYDYNITTDNDTQERQLDKVEIGSYTQLPLAVAYAVTINKAQGKTFDAVNVSPLRCWAPGQLYVALSRVKSVDHLHLIGKVEKSNLVTSQTVLDFYRRLQ